MFAQTSYNFRLQTFTSAIIASIHEVKRTAPKKEIIILGLVLAILQIADALLTTIGVTLFGTQVEGNPLLRCLMENCGVFPALLTAKTWAILAIYFICRISIRVKWASQAIRSMIAVYLFLAIVPWLKILLEHSFFS